MKVEIIQVSMLQWKRGQNIRGSTGTRRDVRRAAGYHGRAGEAVQSAAGR